MRRILHFSPNIYQVGLIAGLVSLLAFFVGLILAYSFRIDTQAYWQPFRVPSFLWLSTTFLALSSWVLEAARFALRRAYIDRYRGRLIASIILGFLFLVLQVSAGFSLARQGVGTTANPHGSAFYLFMGIHGAHLTGGLLCLLYLYAKSRALFTSSENDLRHHRRVVSVAATYWHFMGAVWGVMFYFLLRWTRT